MEKLRDSCRIYSWHWTSSGMPTGIVLWQTVVFVYYTKPNRPLNEFSSLSTKKIRYKLIHKALAKVNGITVISQINLLLDHTESKFAWVDRDPKTDYRSQDFYRNWKSILKRCFHFEKNITTKVGKNSRTHNVSPRKLGIWYYQGIFDIGYFYFHLI